MSAAFAIIPWFQAKPWEIPLGFTLPIFGVDHIPIQPFGLLVAAGVILGARIAEWKARRIGIQPAIVADYITYTLISGFAGAYFLNALFYEPEVWLDIFEQPSLLFKRYLGLSSYGGFIGVVVGSLIWRWRRQIPIMPVADAAAFGFPFGWMLGRTGCFVVHDHPGTPSNFFLAVDAYRVGNPPFVPRHDLGLYEVIWSIAVIALFLWLTRRPRPRGFYLALLPVLYTPVRFYLDFLRAEAEFGGDVRYLGLTPGQYASIGMFILGGGLVLFVLRRPDPLLPVHARLRPSPAGK